jgi:hypothetical protein
LAYGVLHKHCESACRVQIFWWARQVIRLDRLHVPLLATPRSLLCFQYSQFLFDSIPQLQPSCRLSALLSSSSCDICFDKAGSPNACGAAKCQGCQALPSLLLSGVCLSSAESLHKKPRGASCGFERLSIVRCALYYYLFLNAAFITAIQMSYLYMTLLHQSSGQYSLSGIVYGTIPFFSGLPKCPIPSFTIHLFFLNGQGMG